MPSELSIYYKNPDNKQDIKPYNVIIPLSEQCFLVHDNEVISLHDPKNITVIEKSADYTKITFNPIHNTLFCVKEHKENGQISRTLDELTLKDLSPVKTNIPIPFLTPTWLDEDRWLGFDSSFLIVYNHQTKQEETQLAMNVKNLTIQQNIISVDSGYQTSRLCWDNQTLTEIPESKKETPLTHPTNTKKTIVMPNHETLARLTCEEDSSCKIQLITANSHEIDSTFSFKHGIEDIAALSDNHIIATVDSSFANKEVSEKILKEIKTSLPPNLTDPSSIINEYVGNQILYPYSFFHPQSNIETVKDTPEKSPSSKRIKESYTWTYD